MIAGFLIACVAIAAVIGFIINHGLNKPLGQKEKTSTIMDRCPWCKEPVKHTITVTNDGRTIGTHLEKR